MWRPFATATALPYPQFFAVILVALTSLGLGACSDDDDDNPSSNATSGLALPLASRENVISAVASLWVITEDVLSAEAPARPAEPNGADSGVHESTEECPDGGSVSYDEDGKVTTFSNCTLNLLDEEGNVVATEVVNAVISESCDADVQQSVDSCVNGLPYSERFSSEEVTRSIDQDIEIGLVQLEDGYQMLYRTRSIFGYSAEVADESDAGDDETGADEGDGDGATRKATQSSRLEFSSEDFRITQRYPTDPDSGEVSSVGEIELDGELSFARSGSLGPLNGRLRVGTGSPLQAGPEAVPTAGQLVLSTDGVGAIVVEFKADSSIEFRLGGELLTATAEEIGAEAFGEYEVPEDDGGGEGGGEPADDGCPLGLPFCG